MKCYTKLTKKQLIEFIGTIRPKADAYDGVLRTLGIDKDIVGYICKQRSNTKGEAGNSLPPPLGSAVITAWIKEQYELYRYWCEAGPGGTGWACQAGGRKSQAQYVEIRDWLYSCMVAEGCGCGIRWPTKYCPHCGKLANA